MLSNLLQLLNAPLCISVTLLAIATLVKLVQLLNVPSSILTTPSGISTSLIAFGTIIILVCSLLYNTPLTLL